MAYRKEDAAKSHNKYREKKNASESRDSKRREKDDSRSDKRRNVEKKRTSDKKYEKSKSDSVRIESAAEKNKKNRPAKKKYIGCPIYEKCGGCLGQEESYEIHLAQKQKQLQSLIGMYCKLDPMIGMKNPFHYRNKVHAVFAHDKKGPYCGVYEAGTHNVVPVENCKIEDKKASAIILTIRDLLPSFKIKTYNEDKGYGLLRHVLVRKGFQSGEIMVVLVLSSTIMPSKNNFVKALRKVHPEITTIIINENYKNTSMILGEKEQVIYGKGFITDTLCGKTFRISAKSFYQVNPIQTEVLYKKAIDFAGLTGAETILDAYCGIGTIGMIASDYAKKVISVELNPEAVRDAVSNAKRNNIRNIDFYTRDASDFMTDVAEDGREKIDVVFMDPPRAGSDEKFINACAQLAPKKIIYISCNPITLARDLESFTKKGYQVKRAGGVDMFPWTYCTECCCLLERVKP